MAKALLPDHPMVLSWAAHGKAASWEWRQRFLQRHMQLISSGVPNGLDCKRRNVAVETVHAFFDKLQEVSKFHAAKQYLQAGT
jgi:hypothetical protein